MDEFQPIDWPTIRAMVRADAYYRRAAVTMEPFSNRHESLEDRAERLQATRANQVKAQQSKG